MPGGILTVVAVKAIENGSWVVYSAVWVDMLLAWAGGYTVRYMSAIGALRNLCHVVVALQVCRGQNVAL